MKLNSLSRLFIIILSTASISLFADTVDEWLAKINATYESSKTRSVFGAVKEMQSKIWGTDDTLRPLEPNYVEALALFLDQRVEAIPAGDRIPLAKYLDVMGQLQERFGPDSASGKQWLSLRAKKYGLYFDVMSSTQSLDDYVEAFCYSFRHSDFTNEKQMPVFFPAFGPRGHRYLGKKFSSTPAEFLKRFIEKEKETIVSSALSAKPVIEELMYLDSKDARALLSVLLDEVARQKGKLAEEKPSFENRSVRRYVRERLAQRDVLDAVGTLIATSNAQMEKKASVNPPPAEENASVGFFGRVCNGLDKIRKRFNKPK